VKSSELSRTNRIELEQTAPLQQVSGGTTGAITRMLSKRRSSRHQWRIFEYIVMLMLDVVLIIVAFHLAHYIRYNIIGQSNVLSNLEKSLTGNNSTSTFFYTPIDKVTSLEIYIVIGLIVIFVLRGLYNIRLTGSWFRQAWAIINAATLGLTLLISYYFVFQAASPSRLLVPFVWATVIVVLCTGRLIVSGIMSILYRLGLGETRLIVVGSGRLGKLVMQHIAANPRLGYSIVGFLHDMNEAPGDFGRFKMLGTLDDIGMVIRSMQIDEVIIALPSHLNQHAIRSVKMCERLGTSFKLIPDLYEMSLSRIDMETIEGIPLIGIKQVSLNTVQRIVTRSVDIFISTLVLVIGSPLWLLIALLVKLSSPGPIIYRQERIGFKGMPFTTYKFRSMYQDADQRLALLLAQNEAQGPLFKMKEDPRKTPIGNFLRRTSLDEIPQLFNILKGEMSLVGPRPPLRREVEQYEEWQKGRLEMKPGLTGLWQVRGRSDISFDEGVLMDLYYIENWSIRLYFQILFRTIPAVLFSRGAY
jgi:exopolysaccharide biosynthesis polyprenyl glycosylphosphotransferase